MVRSAGGRHDELIAELFEQWQSRTASSPPRDGTVFYGLNLNTGHVYETWFEEKTAAWDAKGAVKLLQKAFDSELGSWWCYEAGRGVTSFIFQVWAPKLPAEHHTKFLADKTVYRTPIGASSRAARKSQPAVPKSLGPCDCGAFTVACVMWFLACYFPAKVPATAPTSHQLEDVLWSEIAKWHRVMKDRLPAVGEQFEWSSGAFRLKSAPNEGFAVARTSRPERPEALQGFHADNILFLVDEASGVADNVFEVAALPGRVCGHDHKRAIR
jgi:hypothetical protein